MSLDGKMAGYRQWSYQALTRAPDSALLSERDPPVLTCRRQWHGAVARSVDRTGTALKRRPAGPAAIIGMALYWAGDIGALAVCVAVFAKRSPDVAAVIVGYATGYVLTPRPFRFRVLDRWRPCFHSLSAGWAFP